MRSYLSVLILLLALSACRPKAEPPKPEPIPAAPLSVPAPAPAPNPESQAQVPAQAPVPAAPPINKENAEIAKALQNNFGNELQAVSELSKYSLTGDFNGDGKVDLLVVTRLVGSNKPSSPNVVVLKNPYGFEDNPGEDLSDRLSLAILHGDASGFTTATPVGKFWLTGATNILILHYKGAIELQKQAANEPDPLAMMQLLKKGEKKKAPSYLPAGAKGDSILFATEAADGILYFDGKTYRFKEDPDGG